MTPESPESFDQPRTRRPHWRKSHFWKTFGTVLVIYFVLRILITSAGNWSRSQSDQKPPVEPPTTPPDSSQP